MAYASFQSKAHATAYNWKSEQINAHNAFVEQRGQIWPCRATGVGGILHNVQLYHSPMETYNFGNLNS